MNPPGLHPGLRSDRQRPARNHGHFDEPAPVIEVTGLGDQVLLERAARGERVAFAELFRRHQDLAWRTAYAGTLSADDAVATVVEAFVHLHRGVRHESVPFRAFVAGAVRDAAQDRVRRRRSVRPSLVSDEAGGDDRSSRARAQGRRAGDAHHPGRATPPGEGEVDLTAPHPADARWDPSAALPSVVPPPPPELWALVQVAYDDHKGLQTPSKAAFSP